MDLSLCAELKLPISHLFYLTDLYSKFNDLQKRLLEKNITIIQARTIVMGFQGKIVI